MSYKADTHMHSIYSYDGQMKLEDMVERGMDLGLEYMAFTEHLEFGQINMNQFLNRYDLYKREVERLQELYPNITLLKGVEVSNPENYSEQMRVLKMLDLDYIIGSNHILPDDNSKREILLYYQRILGMVINCDIDAVGHLDYLRRRVDDSLLPNDMIGVIFKEMIRKNIALEINTSAVRRSGLDSFPSDEKLELYRSLGGNMVTYGSDAHRLYEIYDAIDEVSSKYDFNQGVFVKRKFLSLK